MAFRIEHNGIGLDKSFKTLDKARQYSAAFARKYRRDFMKNDDYGSVTVYRAINKGETEIGNVFLGLDGRARYCDLTGRYAQSYLIMPDGSLTTGRR